MTRKGVEVCAATVPSIAAAIEGGAVRIELCSALTSDGVTPSSGLIKKAIEMCGNRVDIHVLIRCREGDFVYTSDEIAVMCDDIREFAKIAPARSGIVIGALTVDGAIDIDACQKMVEAATGIENITFHRAFDRCCHPFAALDQIIGLGCNRILTSGQAHSALEGAKRLRELKEKAANRLRILPGGGVNSSNASELVKITGVEELHGSCREGGSIHSSAIEIAKIVRAL